MSSLSYRKLRAPEADGAALIDPPLAEVPAIIAANRVSAIDRDRKLGMRSGFCAAARRDFLEATPFSPTANAASNDALPLLIMAGHQPTLVHPGVWFKNFLLSSIGQRVGSAAINLVVDSDTIRTPGIRVPTGDSNDARVIDVLFDTPSDEIPWEQRDLIDPQTFESFPGRVHEALLPLTAESRVGKSLLVDRMWSIADAQRERQVVRAAEILREAGTGLPEVEELVTLLAGRGVDLGRCLVTARHQIEQSAGLVTGEIHVSSLWFWMYFAFFAELLIKRHAEFRAIHNSAVAEYRAINRIRSRSHPVPDLARNGDWTEIPLWMWSMEDTRRRRVFVRQRASMWEISDHDQITIRLSADESAEHPLLFDAAELQGIKLRPRALITTMYARLVLSDLFIHGIGGAKYDELTDEIIRRFFGVEPPRYLTATATFRLPIDRPQVTTDDVRNAARLVRDVRYRPETLVGLPLVASDAALERELQALAAQKREYVRSHTLRKAAHDVFAGLDRINESLREKLQPLEKHLRAEHARLVEQLKQARLLGSREFSFVLYPEEYLVPRLLALAAAEK